MSDNIQHEHCDVAIIGGGPTGLAAAITLKKAGVERVIVLDREADAGGIPRHCGHPPFGIIEFKRLLTGSSYAKRIVETAQNAGVDIRVKTTVTQLGREGKLSLVSPLGVTELAAKRVLLATGTRETPRSARMVSGNRPLGICNTGALQSMVYLKNKVPFRSPVVIGTEIVSFSALFTCKKAGIRPVAMLEGNAHPTVRWPVYYGAKAFGVPLFLQTRLISILGRDRVDAVRVIDAKAREREIGCDGVLFTGQFTPESSLVRMSHLQLDPATGSPVVNEFNRCSDPAYYGAGNLLLHPVKIAGKCWQSGQLTAQWIARDLFAG